MDLQQSRVKRIREARQALDSRGISVSRVDDQIVGLRHKNRSHHQDSAMSLSKPPVSPGSGHRDSARPVGRQMCLIDRVSRNFIGDLQFDETVARKRRGFTDLAVHQNLEHRRRRVRCAIQNLPTTGMPSCGREQAPSTVERFVPGEAPDNHFRRTCRVRSRSAAPRRRVPRTRWQAIATVCDRPTRIWVRAARPRHTRVAQRRPVGRGP